MLVQVQAGRSRQWILTAVALTLLGSAVWLAVRISPRHSAARAVTSIALSSSGKWLASGTAGGHIRIWRLDQSELVRELDLSSGSLNDLRFDPEERYLAVANQNMTLVPLAGAGETRVLRGDRANYGSLRFTSDGRALVTITGRGAIVTVETATGRLTEKVCCSTIYGDGALGPDDKVVVAAGHWPGIWDFQSGRLVGRLTATREFLTFGPIAIDAVRNVVYMGSQDGRVHVWDLATCRKLGVSPAQPGYVTTIAILGRTDWIAYAGQGAAVRLWNIESGESRVIPAARTTSNLVFDALRNRAALGTESGEVEFWDLIQGRRKNPEK